jgi:hypothetical protein
MTTAQEQATTGAAAAAMAAAGLGCAAMGVLTAWAEASDKVKIFLNWYDPVGPLSGKSGGAVLTYIVSWIALGLALRHRDVHLGRWLVVTLLLVAVGLLLTFPPVFDLFGAK